MRSAWPTTAGAGSSPAECKDAKSGSNLCPWPTQHIQGPTCCLVRGAGVAALRAAAAVAAAGGVAGECSAAVGVAAEVCGPVGGLGVGGPVALAQRVCVPQVARQRPRIPVRQPCSMSGGSVMAGVPRQEPCPGSVELVQAPQILQGALHHSPCAGVLIDWTWDAASRLSFASDRSTCRQIG
jgi:hypothetical protein